MLQVPEWMKFYRRRRRRVVRELEFKLVIDSVKFDESMLHVARAMRGFRMGLFWSRHRAEVHEARLARLRAKTPPRRIRQRARFEGGYLIPGPYELLRLYD